MSDTPAPSNPNAVPSLGPPRLETPRLILRALRLDDAPALFAYARDPEVSRFTTWLPYESLADAQRFLAQAQDNYRTGKIGLWAIEKENQMIGTIGLSGEGVNGHFRHARAELAYAIAREFWGQGLVPEAACEILRFGFTSWHLNRIEARCLIENVASARVMEKIGMKFEGILRQQIHFKDAFHDSKMYAILKGDWDKMHKNI